MLGQATLGLLLVAACWLIWTASTYFLHGREGRHRIEAAWMIVTATAIVAVALAPSRGVRTEEAAPRHRAIPVWAVLWVMASGALYWPAFRIGLLSDDYVLAARSVSEIVDPGAWDHYRPVPLLLWRVIAPWGGAGALHALNIVLHGLNAWGVYVLARRTGHRTEASAAAGLIFLTFPAAVEPVAWSSGIFDVGLVSFGLLYLHFSTTARGFWRALACLAAALLTKETAIVLPLVAAILHRRTGIPARTLLASAALTAVYVVGRIVAGITLPQREPAPLRYALKEAVVRPFASLGVPWTGAEQAAHPALGMYAVVLLAALICVYCSRPARGFRPLTAGAIVLAAMLPLWQFFFVAENLEGSRYLYLPLVGWCLLLIDLVPEYGRARLPALAGILLLVPLGVWGIRQHLKDWVAAASARDAVIAEARRELTRSGCSRVQFTEVPETVGGAFVFRNGLSTALEAEKLPGSGTGAPCTLAWRGDRFERIE